MRRSTHEIRDEPREGVILEAKIRKCFKEKQGDIRMLQKGQVGARELWWH